VERLGSARWLAANGTETAKAEYAVFDGRRQKFRALTRATRLRLLAIYESNKLLSDDKYEFIAMKLVVIDDFKAQYEQLKTGWNGYAGYDAWVKTANNASFGAQAAYDDGVPQFEALFAQQGGDWVKFFKTVQHLAKMPKAERETVLKVALDKSHLNLNSKQKKEEHG
jgi:predicted aminopeptidase